MMSFTEILSKPPKDHFLGVVELDNSLLVGIIDDPLGVELSAIRLGYPLEIAQRWEGPDVHQLVVVPEAGVPHEMVVEAWGVAIHSGDSPFGETYFKSLREITRIAPKSFVIKQIQRASIPKGGAGGTQR